MAPDAELVCPSCGTAGAREERFCAACGMPLTFRDAAEPLGPTAAQERARKIKPQFTEGELVRVGWARHQAEAELIQGLLLEHGVPSMLRRSRGFDVPDMLAAGPRDVLVPASGAPTARDALLEADLLGPEPGPPVSRPGRLLAVLCASVALVGLIAWVGSELVGRA